MGWGEKVRANKLRVIQGGNKRGNKLWRRLFLAGVIVLALFLLWNSLGYLALWAADVTVASSKQVVASVPVNCFVLRTEYLIQSPEAGGYAPFLENGAKVSKDLKIGCLTGSGGEAPILAPAAGLILNDLDGFEGRFLPGKMLDPGLVDCVASYIDSPPEPKPATQVNKGDCLGVIITNSSYRLLTAMDFHTEGQRQQLEAEDGTTYTLTPLHVIQARNQFWVLWDVPSLSDELIKTRSFSGQLISQKEEAVLVPAGALCSKDGNTGVIVLFREKPVFNQVEVLCTLGDQVAVKGLAHGQRVLTLPWWASLAKRWWLK